MDEWIKKMGDGDIHGYTHIYVYTHAHKWYTLFCSLKEHYAKWNKPDTERQLQADLSCMWNLKKVQLIKAEYKVGCQGLGSGENGGDVA